MSVTYPLLVFEKDHKSMCLIEEERRILCRLEAIDIEGEEYVFWDANGKGVSVTVAASGTFGQGKLSEVTSCPPVFPIQDALKAYAASLGLCEMVAEGAPLDVWSRIPAEPDRRPRKRNFLSRLFARKK